MPKLTISSAPHIRAEHSIQSIMLDVLFALLPAALAGIYFFGLKSLLLIATCVITCVAVEWLYQNACGFRITVSDLSAAVTGLLLALVLPPQTPWWAAGTGSIVAILVTKQFFGGLGHNIFNPALIGRAFLMASWPAYMTTWAQPAGLYSHDWLSLTDAVTGATPLALAKTGQYTSQIDLFLGSVGGCVGETSALALLLGACYLLLRGHIGWQTPASYLGTVALLSWVLGENGFFTGHPMFHLLAGGLILGAFFMATDPVTTPLTGKGKIIFGLGAGILTVVIRKYGGYPEGVCYSILLMNAVTPLIDRFTAKRRLEAGK
ncbi:MAG: RnfABCDGE type electron transport complex subunit D [Candidatus Wallbacteria bacterium]|nr:RnfABCDGE type electron transport complex subunit D [Candidatus Wallbacteria bacterium]